MNNNLIKLLHSVPTIQMGSLLKIISDVINNRISTQVKPVKDKPNTFSVRNSNWYIVYVTSGGNEPLISLISYDIKSKT
jgi:hypothetical protein